MARLTRFFAEWDDLEAAHPFGVVRFAPLFMEHGVPQALALDVDECLFLDLMTPRHMEIRRIKVEERVSQRVFWVYVDLGARAISFQENPMAPLRWSVVLDGDCPWELVRLVFQRHRMQARWGGLFAEKCSARFALPENSRRDARHRAV
jgi:hypothetical protein